jgi:spore germination protein YaaH
MGMPWYGYDYECDDSIYGSNTPPAGVRGKPCKVSGGVRSGHAKQVPYSGQIELLNNNRSSELTYNHSTVAEHFDYYPGGNASQARHQVWMDTPATLAIKYAWAKRKGLRGVAIWETGDVDYGNKNGGWLEMWDALSVLK